MNYKRISALAAMSLFLGYNSIAQTIKFKTESHDFGIVEEGVQAAFTFEVTNTGTAPLVISSVQPSCGCTTPEWSKEPIMPGKTGLIKASYNSQGRLGVFNKSIAVVSNATNETNKTIYIRGIVEKKEENKFTAAELKASPRLTVDKVSYNFGKIEKGQRVNYKFKVTNTGMSDLKIPLNNAALAGCGCIEYKISKETIKPKETVILELIYTPKNLGEVEEVVSISSNDIVSKYAKITLKANVVGSFATPNIMKEGNQNVPFK